MFFEVKIVSLQCSTINIFFICADKSKELDFAQAVQLILNATRCFQSQPLTKCGIYGCSKLICVWKKGLNMVCTDLSGRKGDLY